MVPTTRLCTALTIAIARSAAALVPNVVAAMNVAVFCSRPHGSWR